MFKRKKTQKGFSFIEIAIVVAIIAAGVAVAISIGSSVKASNNVKDASNEIANVAAAAQNSYSYSRGDFTGISAGVLSKTAKIPDTMKDSPTTPTKIINTFGYDILVAVGTPVNRFVITYPTPDSRTCGDVVANNINKYTKLTAGTVTTNITTLAQAQTACAGTGIINIKVTVKQ